MTDQPTDAAVEQWGPWEQVGYWKEKARQAEAARDAVNAYLPRYQQALSVMKAERQRAERAEVALETAATQISDLARRLGEAEGRLEASDNVHIMAQWKERAERAERYMHAIKDELIISYIFTEKLAADPRRAIAAIIDWNCKIALDPAVSEAACALQQSGAERAEKLLAGAILDKERIDALSEECWDLRCFSVPTGGGDADVGWRVVGHWEAKPHERTIAEVFNHNPRAAIDTALATLRAPEQPAGGEG